MVFSEFGRRLEESDSAGTDHGSGGPIMLSGSAVKGGLAGEHPGVNVNQDGDLVVKTDFRTVYQSLIAEWLGGDPTAILPGGPFPGIAALRRRHHADEGRVAPSRRSRWFARPTLLALLVLALAAAPGVAGSAGERLHRLHVPPPAARGAAAVARGGRVRVGHARHAPRRSPPGTLRIHVYNRGMDDHDLAVVDAHGQLHTVPLASGADAVLERRRRAPAR